MQYFRLVTTLVALNIFIQTTHASSSYIIEEEPQQGRNLSISREDKSSSWSLSNLWQSFQQAVSSRLLPYISPSEKPTPSKIIEASWWKTPSSEEGNFAHQWHKIVTYIVEENLKHAQLLSSRVQERENDYKSTEGKNLSRHKKLSQLLGKEAQRIATYDEILVKESKKISLPQYLGFLASFNGEEKNLPLLREVLKEFYAKVERSSLGNDFYDSDLFQKGFYLADCLWQIGTLERHPGNLSKLKSIVLNSYKFIENGDLDDISDKLKSLGIVSHSARTFGMSRLFSGSSLLFLILSSSMINVASALPLRSAALGIACSDDYKQCASGYTLFDFYNTTLEVNSILSNSYFMNTTQQTLLEPNRLTALNTTLNNIYNLMNTTEWYSEITAFSVNSVPTGNATRQIYSLPAPFYAFHYHSINDTAYQEFFYRIYDIYQPINNTEIYTLTGTSGEYYFLDQFPNTEVWFFPVMINQTFGVGTAVMRPSQGNPSILWQRVITRDSAINNAASASISRTKVNNNKPARATLEDNNTFDNMTLLYRGNVGQPYCQGDQTIEEYLASQPSYITSLSNKLISCMPVTGLDPLACFRVASDYSYPYVRLSTFFMENTLGNLTYHRRIVDGPSYRDCSYKALTSQATQETCHTYVWSPKYDNISTISQVLPQNMSSLYGSLKLGELHKVAEIFFPDTSVEGVILETLQNSSGVFGPNYYAYCGSPTSSPSPTPGGSSSSSSDSTVIGAAVGGSVGGVAALACLTTGAVIAGVKYHKHNKKKAFEEEEDDIEMDNRSTHIVSQDAFNAKGEGLEDARLRVKGAMHGLRYGLYFTVDRHEAREIKAQTGLKIIVPKDEEETPFHLGAGNFGRVIIAKEEGTGQFRAMKIVAGTKNVKASLREGKLQARLGQKEGVLPLLEYLHFAPTGKNKKQMKQLLAATFGSPTIQGEDMTTQDLLLQVTPLAALGNGETFQKNLVEISNKKLKDHLLTHFALSLLSGLKNMHDDGVTHLDIKPSNVLVHTDGTVYVSDFGCALQKDNLRGGLGDFRYFSPERIGHCRLLMHRRGQEFDAMEMFPYFSGKAADSFAAGLTLLEIATNKYPLGVATSVTHMLNERDSDYFKDHLKDAFEEVSKNLTILPVIKGLLQTKPKKRLSTLKAHEELLKLKPKASSHELFGDLRRALLEKGHSAKSKAINTGPVSSSSTSYAYENKLPSHQNDEKELASIYENKLPSEQVYGEEIPSLYKELGQDYSEASDLKSSNYSDKADDVYSVPRLSSFNDNDELASSNESEGGEDVYSMPKLSPFNDNKGGEAPYAEPELSAFDEDSYAYTTPKFKP